LWAFGITLRASVEPALPRSGASGIQGPTGIICLRSYRSDGTTRLSVAVAGGGACRAVAGGEGGSCAHHPRTHLQGRSAVAVRDILDLQALERSAEQPEIKLGVIVQAKIGRGFEQGAIKIDVGLGDHQ